MLYITFLILVLFANLSSNCLDSVCVCCLQGLYNSNPNVITRIELEPRARHGQRSIIMLLLLSAPSSAREYAFR